MAQEQQMKPTNPQPAQPQPAQKPGMNTLPMTDEKKFFQKWWFWVIVVVLVGLGVYYLFF